MAAETSARVVFRVDGSAKIGSGHMARCLALAEALSRRGARIAFISRELPGDLLHTVEADGHELLRLPAPRAATEGWLTVPVAQDAAETRAALERAPADWLVVDHYGIDATWERAQRGATKSICVIDDLANRPHDADVLVDQQFVPDPERRYDGLVGESCRRLVGPRFAMLRARYAELRRLRERRRERERVFVFFGGSDSTDETSKALRALSTPPLAKLQVDVVLGVNHPAPATVEALVAARPGTTLHRARPSLAELMSAADLAVGAGGTTTWERLALRLPSVVVTVAANQEPATATLAAAGLVTWAGRAEEVDEAALARAIGAALTAPALDRTLVDGEGAARVAALLLPPSPAKVLLERATPADSELLFEWRNEAATRAMSFESDPVPWEQHSRWFADKLAAPDTEIYIARAANVPIGQVRIDYRGDEAVLSYGVDEIARGRGFGMAIVERAVRSARRTPPQGFRAAVKRANGASARIFEKLGWQKQLDGADLIFRLRETR